MTNILALGLALLFICDANTLSNDNKFPDNFMLGTGSSAYQIEGAWKDDLKSESIWDHDLHDNSSLVEDNTNGDVTADSYDHVADDIEALKEMGVNHYKFSVSWTRLLPGGIYINDTQNPTGLNYYNNLIDELLTANITPIVTLYHWDLPESIEEWGGWTNESNIDYFVDYARFVFRSFSKVTYFITFADPKAICKSGYGDGSLAPFKKNSGVDDYACVRIILKAHAAVYKMYRNEFKKGGAMLSIALDASWSEAASDSDADKEAAERRNQFEFGLYANPIFNGNWPEMVIQRTDIRSRLENRTLPRLPELTAAEKAAIKGTVDFMAIDFFDTYLVADDEESQDYTVASYDKDMRVKISVASEWTTDADDHTIVVGSLRKFLNYTKENYGNPKILITANGIADTDGTTHDGDRVNFLQNQLTEVLSSINKDEVQVFGYTYWSLLDSFEWTKGDKPHFGLYAIDLDFADNSTRVPKRSSYYYALAAKGKRVPDPSELITTDLPESTTSETTTLLPESTTHGGAYSLTGGTKVLVLILTVFLTFLQRCS